MPLYKNYVCRAMVIVVALAALAICLSCGNNNYNYYGYQNPSATSGFQHRVMLTNAYAGTVVILNPDNDVVYGRTINLAANDQILAESHDGTFTLAYSNGTSNVLSYIDNKIEDISGNTISLTGNVESLAVMSDNRTAVTASRNAPVNGQPTGVVFVIDLMPYSSQNPPTNRVITGVIPVPLVRRIVTNHAGTKVLAFADNTNTAYVIDTTAFTATPIADPGGLLDRPVTAVFSSDDTKAYILSCGSECGGTQASVTAFDPSANTLGASVPVAGATSGILDSSGNLYVAGSPNGAGMMQIINTGSFSAGTTPSMAVAIANGYHSQMAFTDDNRLYVGSTNCTNITNSGTPVQGCLSTYNLSTQAVVNTAPPGDVTGIQPIIGKHKVYVVQGGELVIYDTTTDGPRLPVSSQIDVVGQAYAVLQIS
jgi:hypothetical protein